VARPQEPTEAHHHHLRTEEGDTARPHRRRDEATTPHRLGATIRRPGVMIRLLDGTTPRRGDMQADQRQGIEMQITIVRVHARGRDRQGRARGRFRRGRGVGRHRGGEGEGEVGGKVHQEGAGGRGGVRATRAIRAGAGVGVGVGGGMDGGR